MTLEDWLKGIENGLVVDVSLRTSDGKDRSTVWNERFPYIHLLKCWRLTGKRMSTPE
jgi:hypothetical protein